MQFFFYIIDKSTIPLMSINFPEMNTDC